MGGYRDVGRRRAAAPAAAAAMLVVAACSTAEAPGARDAPAPAAPAPATTAAGAAGLSASVVQYRRDAQRDVVQVKVTNGGDAPVRVTRVRLDTATFTGPVEAGKDSLVRPGLSADLTVPLGEPACPAAGGTARAGAAATVTLDVDGSLVELPVDGEVLATVAAERCAAAAVAAQVALEVGPGWADAGDVRGEPALRGTVVAAPRPGAASLRLAVEGATTLFTVAEPSAAVLPAGSSAPAELDVVLTVTRCDPHAVAEDKKGYLLPVRVAVDGAEAVLVEVAVPVPGRRPLQGLIDRTCGP